VLPNGNEACAAGSYPVALVDRFGCDSLVLVELTAVRPDTTFLSATLCTNNSLFLARDTVIAPGDYAFVYENFGGCDSTVLLSLAWANGCSFAVPLLATPVSCAGGRDGRVAIRVGPAADLPVNYTLVLLGAGRVADGIIDAGAVTIDNLSTGTYTIVATDASGNISYANTLITSPEVLRLTATEDRFNNFSVSCRNGADGRLRLEASGGTAPYRYNWADGGTDANRTDLTAGNYRPTVTDANGCTRTLDIALDEPALLTINFVAMRTTCSSPTVGGLRLNGLSGGVPPYTIVVANENGRLYPPESYDALPVAEYRIEVIDANGCLADTVFSLTETPFPAPVLLVSEGRPEWGEEITLEVTGQYLDTINWPEGVSPDCENCAAATYLPINTRPLVVTARSSAGCIGRDTFDLLVVQKQKVYLPSAFSPNDDGVNDVFGPFLGQGVSAVGEMTIYDRWGGEIFVSQPSGPSSLSVWQGADAWGHPLPTGVYLYRITVRFLDGREELYRGTVSLIR